MNIYMAAVYTNNYRKDMVRYPRFTPVEQKIVDDIPFILESYHYINNKNILATMREHKVKVFLDSGAFSAWTKGATIDIVHFARYVKEYDDLWLREGDSILCSVLDGIGDPYETYQNQKKLERLGVSVLPCYHFGDNEERFLEYYVANYDYITIGGMVGKSTKMLISWLDDIWHRYLLDGSGKPKTKVHAFGITSIEIMKRYPWHSCDSSSWIQAAAFGNIITPYWGILSISDKSARKHCAGQHVTTFKPQELQVLDDFITNENFTVERLSTLYESRAIFNLNSFKYISANINKNTPTMFEGYNTGLF